MKFPEEFLNQIITGDCIDVMKEIPNGSIDLVVTSPPYNMTGKSLGYHPRSTTGDNFYCNDKDNKKIDEYQEFIYKAVSECIRVSRYTFFVIQMLTNNKDCVLSMMKDFRENIKDIFIWRKVAVSQIAKGKMATGYEFVFVFGRDNKMIFDYRNFPPNNYVPNIKEFYKKKTDTFKEHHAVFPLELATYFIENFSKEKDTVLDPFMGVGTTALACKNTGRNFIGIEKEPSYVEVANKRLNSGEVIIQKT